MNEVPPLKTTFRGGSNCVTPRVGEVLFRCCCVVFRALYNDKVSTKYVGPILSDYQWRHQIFFFFFFFFFGWKKGGKCGGGGGQN